MAGILRRMRSRQSQSESAAAAQCDDICTEEWEDYVLVTVDPNQPVNKHRVCSIESSLDSGYEEIHMPPPGGTAAISEEGAAAGAGSISAGANNNNEAKQETEEERPECRTDRDLGQHHGFFGQRYYKYDDTECEGNRYITNEEL